MCVSLEPVKFNTTVIANFPEGGNDPQSHILSYMNTATGVGGSAINGVDAGPNAIIFPVYGEVTGVATCADPKASRAWLDQQRGVYHEQWGYDPGSMRASFGGPSPIMLAGNYLVGIASDIESIPGVLDALRREAPHPEHVPDAGDETLEMLSRFYREQNLGVPSFVVGAFALAGDQVDQKNPITVRYTQRPDLQHLAIFPAVDHHGEGPFMPRVQRDHRLLLSTAELDDMFRPAMTPQGDQARPAEFARAPRQFPIEVVDKREGDFDADDRALAILDSATIDMLRRTQAPNGDYFINLDTLLAALRAHRSSFAALRPPREVDYFAEIARRKAIGSVVTDALGPTGVLGHSNQPLGEAEEFVAAANSLGGMFDTSNTNR